MNWILLLLATLAPLDATRAVEADPEARMTELFAETRANSLSAAVVDQGEVVWSMHLGAARDGVRYRIGSVSKVVTAAVAARMVDAGIVRWDQPVSDLVPDFAGLTPAVTLRRLADHTGGVRHYHFNEDDAIRAPVARARDALHIFEADAFSYTPGEGFEYSSYGYTLLSAALEVAGGAPFPELLERYLTEPAELNGIAPDAGNTPGPMDAAVFEGLSEAEPRDISYKWAGGGLRASVEDLARFGYLVSAEGEFLGRDGRAAMIEPTLGADGSANPHAAGWVADRLETGETVLFHDGEVRGGHAHLVSVPDWGLTAAIAVNRGSFFSLSQGMALLCDYRGLEECPAAVAQSSREAQIETAIGAIRVASSELRQSLTEGDVEVLDRLTADGFDGSPWPTKDELLAGLAAAFEEGVLTPLDVESHMQIGGADPGSTARLSGNYYDRVFTAEADLVFVFAFDGERWSLIRIEPNG